MITLNADYVQMIKCFDSNICVEDDNVFKYIYLNEIVMCVKLLHVCLRMILNVYTDLLYAMSTCFYD